MDVCASEIVKCNCERMTNRETADWHELHDHDNNCNVYECKYCKLMLKEFTGKKLKTCSRFSKKRLISENTFKHYEHCATKHMRCSKCDVEMWQMYKDEHRCGDVFLCYVCETFVPLNESKQYTNQEKHKPIFQRTERPHSLL